MVISGKKAIQSIVQDHTIKKLIKVVYTCSTQKYIISLCQENRVKCEIKDKSFFDQHYNDKSKYKYKYAIAIVENKPELTLKELINKQPQKSLLVMLDHIQDPFNLGAIMRTCAAAGVNGIIMPKDNQAPLNHNATLKASQGYALNLDVCVVPNLHQALLLLKKADYWIYATDINEKAKTFNKIEYADRSVLILGSEGDGVSDLLKRTSDYQVYIPMKPGIDSLNVSVAAGVFIFEMLKGKED